MGGLWNKALEEATKWAESLKQDFFNNKIETRLTVRYFSEALGSPIIEDMHIRDFEGIPKFNPSFRSTRLWRSLDEATVDLKNKAEKRSAYAENAFLVLVVSDGANTDHPTSYSGSVKPQDEHWTFSSAGPFGSKRAFLMNGFDEGNLTEWEQTHDGLEKMSGQTVNSVQSYTTARASGLTKSKTFYTDASNITTKDIKNLNVVHPKQYSVDSEALVREFVEQKTKTPYQLGSAYYLLQKKERIQSHKKLILFDKKAKTYYNDGRESVRDLLGIRSTGEIRVEPGNHANFDIYVQSGSVNRILPRGTKVLVLT